MTGAAAAVGGGQSELTTGWEPVNGLAVDDTVLRQYVHHSAAYWSSIAVAHGGWVHEHDELSVASCRRDVPFANSATLLQPPFDDDWDVVQECVDGVYRHDGIDDYYLWSAWPTPDLSDRGWTLVGHPPLILGRPPTPLPPSTAGLDVRRVDSAEGLHDWECVVVDGYPLPQLQPFEAGCVLPLSILDDERWCFWVGYDSGRPVAVGTQFVSHGLAQLGLDVTLPKARRKGFWYALVRERMLAEPDLLHVGLFSDDSQAGVRALGFLPLTRFTLWRGGAPRTTS